MKMKKIWYQAVLIVVLMVALAVPSDGTHAEREGKIRLTPMTVSDGSTGIANDGPPKEMEMPTGIREATYHIEKTSSSVVAAPQTLKTAVKQTTALISKRISNVIAPVPAGGKKFQKPIFGFNMDDYGMGLSAGDREQKFGIWGNFAITGSDDEHAITESDFDLNNYIIGIDCRFTPKTVAGLSLTYETLDGTTKYNAGEMDSDGFTLSPYFAVLIADHFSIDLSAGYSWINVDQNRNQERRIEPGRDVIKSSLDSERMFVSANANGYYAVDRLNLSGNVGYLYAQEEQDPFTETDDINYSRDVSSNKIQFGQLNVGGEIGYAFDSWEPYFNAAFEYDTSYDKDISTYGQDISDVDYDRSGFTVGGGFRFLIFNALQGDVQATKVLARENYDEHSVMGNLRFEF